ncbi:MAG: ribosome biogenesis GTPase Der [Alphaproteobacteria bacterium]
MITIALIGRPNVGKSTLFNRLVGKKVALVHDEPGVTRDRRFGTGQIADITFQLIDTPGVESANLSKSASILSAGLWQQTEHAIKDADLLLFILDGREGVTALDEEFARKIRKSGKACRIVVNKAEGKAADQTLFESEQLGFGSPVPVSAEHGEGLVLLYEVIRDFEDTSELSNLTMPEELGSENDLNPQDQQHPLKPFNIAIVGRPNAGKSTLINQILKEERFLTGPTAGLTRDTQSVSLKWQGRDIELFDTAGLRKKAKVHTVLEKMSARETERAIQFAEAVCLVIDATTPLERQDLTLAHHVVGEGRILLLVLNKIDLLPDVDSFLKEMRLRIKEELPQVVQLCMVHVSALAGRNIDKIFIKLFELHETWNQRISTGKLNNWLTAIQAHHPPPLAKGRRIKIRYMTQIKTRPPTFVLFVSQAKELPESYLRYLKNRLAKDFGLHGVPLRLSPRSGKNPFADKD